MEYDGVQYIREHLKFFPVSGDMEQLVLLRAWNKLQMSLLVAAVLWYAGMCAAEKQLNYSERDGTVLPKEF